MPKPPPRDPVRRPAKVARMLALAHHIQWAIDRGEVPDAATVARRLGLTRARVSQLLGLCFLAPSIQEEILALEAVDGAEPMAERVLRQMAREVVWDGQRRASTSSPAVCQRQRDHPVRLLDASPGRVGTAFEAGTTWTALDGVPSTSSPVMRSWTASSPESIRIRPGLRPPRRDFRRHRRAAACSSRTRAGGWH